MEKYQKIEILWLDAIRTDGWGEESTMTNNDMRAKTVGYFVGETDQFIILKSTYAPFREEESLQSIKIPKGCIIKINKL